MAGKLCQKRNRWAVPSSEAPESRPTPWRLWLPCPPPHSGAAFTVKQIWIQVSALPMIHAVYSLKSLFTFLGLNFLICKMG